MASRKQDFPKEEAELRAKLDDPEAWDTLLWLAELEADWARAIAKAKPAKRAQLLTAMRATAKRGTEPKLVLEATCSRAAVGPRRARPETRRSSRSTGKHRLPAIVAPPLRRSARGGAAGTGVQESSSARLPRCGARRSRPPMAARYAPRTYKSHPCSSEGTEEEGTEEEGVTVGARSRCTAKLLRC